MSKYHDPNPNGHPQIVFLHGLGTSKKSWWFQMQPFAQANLRPIALDIPGFGEASNPAYKWNIPAVASELVKEISTITSTPVILVGLSLGGCIALQIMLDHPTLIRAAVLVNTFATIRKIRISEFSYFVRRMTSILFIGMEKQAEIVARRVFPKPEQEVYRDMVIRGIVDSDVAMYRKAMVELFRLDLTGRLAEITQPTLILTGEDDTTLPKESQAKLAQAIRNSEHIVIHDSGHATPVDQPEVFNDAVLDYINHNS